MISADDNPGLFYFLVGMVVLVMAGVGLSIMIDKRFSFSRGSNEMREDLVSGSNEMAELKALLESHLTEFSGSDSRLRGDAVALKDLNTRSAGLRQRSADLTAKRSALREANEALDLKFSTYRGSYIRRARETAVGEKLVNLNLRDGRTYPMATISKVTDAGLEIRHEHGIARIAAEDLPPQWRERFLWGDEERRDREKAALRQREEEAAALLARAKEDESRAKEAARRIAEGWVEEMPVVEEGPVENPVPAPRDVAAIPQPLPRGGDSEAVRDEQRAKLAERQRLVSGWQSKVTSLSASLSEARSHVGYGENSVPGRLETWKAREQRLSAELIKAQTELSVVRSKLAAVAPGDPLLHWQH